MSLYCKTVEVSFYGEKLPLKAPKNYLILLNSIQDNFGVEPESFDNLVLKVITMDKKHPKELKLTEELYNTLIKKYKFIQIEIENE